MKFDSATTFPLHWPKHRPRTKHPTRASFHRRELVEGGYQAKRSLTVCDSQSRIRRELELLGALATVISTNIELRQDGLPYSNRREPHDSGAAVYFRLSGQPHCLSCDKWNRVADNLAAIAKHVEAMRGQLRWGVADVATMFAGFKALPGAIITDPPMSVEDAARFVALHGDAKPAAVESVADVFADAYRTAAKKLHPDANQGVHSPEWNTLQRAAGVLKLHHGQREAAA